MQTGKAKSKDVGAVMKTAATNCQNLMPKMQRQHISNQIQRYDLQIITWMGNTDYLSILSSADYKIRSSSEVKKNRKDYSTQARIKASSHTEYEHKLKSNNCKINISNLDINFKKS